MRILHYTRYYPFPVVYELAKRQIAMGHEVAVVCWPGMSKVEKGTTAHEGIKVYCFGIDVHTNPARFKLAPFKLLRELNDFTYLSKKLKGFDVLHVHGPTFYTYPKMYEFVGVPGWGAASRAAKIPVVWTFHGHAALLPKYFKAIKNEMRFATERTAVSREVVRCLDALWIPNGVDTERFKPLNEKDKVEFRSRYKIPQEKVVIIMVGRWIPRKGHDILLKSLKLLEISLRNKIYVVFIGPTDRGFLDYFTSVVNELYALDIGFTTLSPSDAEIPLFYGLSDIFVFPSRSEGDPLVVKEAMSSGLPCIVSKVGKEVIKQGVEGFLIKDAKELAAYLALLVEDERLRNRLGRNARESALKYDWDLITAQYLTVYKSVLSHFS